MTHQIYFHNAQIIIIALKKYYFISIWYCMVWLNTLIAEQLVQVTWLAQCRALYTYFSAVLGSKLGRNAD